MDVSSIAKQLADFVKPYNNLKIKVEVKIMTKEDLIKQLNVLIHKINSEGSKTATFRIKQYTDMIRLVETFPSEDIDELDKLSDWFIRNGKKNPKKMIEKIKTYQDTGYFPEVKEALKSPLIQAVINLTKVANIGPAKAKELFNKYKIVTIDDLKKKFSEDKSIIHGKQQLGLKYHDDLLKRIPREEMIAYNTILQEICRKISPEMKFSINGSFRRENSSSGDIDVLISGPKGKNQELRNKFIEELKKSGIIKDILASGKKKFMGISRLDGYSIYRHIDIIDTDIEMYPFAQLYFTGSGGFNSHMRLLALKKGYSLNEYCISDKKTKKAVDEALIQEKIGKSTIETEKDIFRFLELDYVVPSKRNTLTLSKIL